MIYLILTIFFVYIIFKNKETFDGYGKSFGEYISPQRCLPEENCFKGSYQKKSIYQNMCQPIFTLMNKIKIPLFLDCIKILR